MEKVYDTFLVSENRWRRAFGTQSEFTTILDDKKNELPSPSPGSYDRMGFFP